MPSEHHGGCLCGAVRFSVSSPMRDVVICHCRECRKQSGHLWASTGVPLDQFRLTDGEGLVWYHATAQARRGFCGQCGSFLFWEPAEQGRIAIAMGALDGPSGLGIEEHFLTEGGSDYDPDSTARHDPPGATLRVACLCGGCAFDAPAPAGPITACHCTQCRRLSGHFSASFDADAAALHWLSDSTLRVIDGPQGSSRGFCGTCGGKLWFRAADGAFAIEAGAVEGATGGRITAHIHLASRGDYDPLPKGGALFEGDLPADHGA